eukprot:TRINITY_DN3673_c0_g3_i1.p1 TRINITY_DN3673_c0_g3~~TRINITY_DN3673_c0_g3_i1.p1  ORF type:complete len:191 (-),score=31.41 TRINITY_DN3673_c0_g3_i1:192-764(-)
MFNLKFSKKEKFLTIIEALYKLRNLSAVKAMWSSFDSTPLWRLKKTHEEILLKSRWVQLREEVRNIISTDAHDLRREYSRCLPPLIPYLGLYLTDFVKICEGNPKFLDNGLINFNRWRLLTMTIRGMQQYQVGNYEELITEAPMIVQEFQKVKIMTDMDDLTELSYYLEGRNGNEHGPRPTFLDQFLVLS